MQQRTYPPLVCGSVYVCVRVCASAVRTYVILFGAFGACYSEFARAHARTYIRTRVCSGAYKSVSKIYARIPPLPMRVQSIHALVIYTCSICAYMLRQHRRSCLFGCCGEIASARDSVCARSYVFTIHAFIERRFHVFPLHITCKQFRQYFRMTVKVYAHTYTKNARGAYYYARTTAMRRVRIANELSSRLGGN